MKHLLTYNSYSMRIAAVLAAVCAVAVFMYGTFLLMAVAHAAELSRAEEQTRLLSAQTSVLEGEYLSRSSSLTAARALVLGFVEPKEEWVVYAAPAALVVNR